MDPATPANPIEEASGSQSPDFFNSAESDLLDGVCFDQERERSDSIKLDSMPSEVLVAILRNLPPKQVAAVGTVCRRLRRVVLRHRQCLSRVHATTCEITAVPHSDNKMQKFVATVTGLRGNDTVCRVLKSQQLISRSLSDAPLRYISNVFGLCCNGSVHITGVTFTKRCLVEVSNYIVDSVNQYSPSGRITHSFSLHLNGCMFTNVSTSDITRFVNCIIKAQCYCLAINDVHYSDFIKLCKALSKSNIQLLSTFRFHSRDIASHHTDPLKAVLLPFLRNNRKTRRLVLDGFCFPLKFNEWVMINFCCTEYFHILPPKLRIILSIDSAHTREELVGMLGVVRQCVNDNRNGLRSEHRFNQVYLELGVYESEITITGLQHCIVDVDVTKSRNPRKPKAEK